MHHKSSRWCPLNHIIRFPNKLSYFNLIAWKCIISTLRYLIWLFWMTRKAPGSSCRRSFSLEMLFSYVFYATLNAAIFTGQRLGEINISVPGIEIRFMELFDAWELCLQVVVDGWWQSCKAVISTHSRLVLSCRNSDGISEPAGPDPWDANPDLVWIWVFFHDIKQ